MRVVPGPVAPACPPRRWRRLPGVSPLLAVLLLVIAGATAGCGSLAEAQQAVGRADLVNELSARLSAAEELTYSADYQLPLGRSASITQQQDPPRTAYAYPGGLLLVDADATTECEGAGARSSCVRTPPPSPSANPDSSLFERPGMHGLVPPRVVISLLTAAALDPDAVIEQHDTTVAGEHATCVDVHAVENAPAASFAACITTAGVLGSFTGVVNGTPVELTLTRYSTAVDEAAFTLPEGAKVVDRRAGS